MKHSEAKKLDFFLSRWWSLSKSTQLILVCTSLCMSNFCHSLNNRIIFVWQDTKILLLSFSLLSSDLMECFTSTCAKTVTLTIVSSMPGLGFAPLLPTQSPSNPKAAIWAWLHCRPTHPCTSSFSSKPLPQMASYSSILEMEMILSLSNWLKGKLHFDIMHVNLSPIKLAKQAVSKCSVFVWVYCTGYPEWLRNISDWLCCVCITPVVHFTLLNYTWWTHFMPVPIYYLISHSYYYDNIILMILWLSQQI